MNPNRPIAWKPNRTRQTSTLYFGRGVDHEFYLRGAVCWPFYSQRDNKVRGYAILAGMKVGDRKIHVFEEMEFFEIDSIINEHEAIHGFAHMVGIAWAHYGCKRWFDRIDSDPKWRDRVRRADQVEPRPFFQDVTVEAGAYQDFVLRYIQSSHIEYLASGGIHNSLEEMRQTEGRSYADYPELMATGLLLAGLEEWPFRHADQPHDFPIAPRAW